MSTKILLVEPNKILRERYAFALGRQGYDVACAKTAQQAIALADADMPALVILDVHLAEHGGVEFLYEFKSYPEWQAVPVIVLTPQQHGQGDHSWSALASLQIVQVLVRPRLTMAALCTAVAEAVAPQKETSV
jgi:CheY-like chemotaxis protein